MNIKEALSYLKNNRPHIINNYNLVLTDFDNTLQPHSEIPYYLSIEIMLELMHHGFVCGIITGRPGNNLKAKCKELGIWELVKQLSFVITDNGNSAYLPKDAKDYINIGISPHEAYEIIKYTNDKKLGAVLNTDRGIYINGLLDSAKTPLERLLYNEIEIFEIEKFTGKFLQINIGEPLEASTLKLSNNLAISKWDDKFYAVGIKGGKANAYQAIVQEYQKNGIYFTNMYAFGDQNNDIEMFELPGVTSYAVSNASADLKAIANHISDYSVSDNAVGQELLKIYLGKNVLNKT